MITETDAELLRRYAEDNSEAAFAELVRRRVNLVYSVALRQCGGDASLAEDVTQKVFADLARKAVELSGRAVLTGWLYRSAQFAASDTVRAERRRRAREEKAHTMQVTTKDAEAPADWEEVRPVLDETMGELADADRDAVALRFFEERSFAEIGRALQLSEEAARKRVDRAVDKLHALLAKRAVNSTAAALAVALANQAGVAAPAGLAAGVASVAMAEATTAASGATTAGILSIMGTAKFIVALSMIVGAVAVGVATKHTRAASAARAEFTLVTQQQVALQERLRALGNSLTAAERRAQAADADAARLLKAIQDASPTVALPPGDATCMAFVIDTSGSMRDPKTDRLWSVVSQVIRDALAAHSDARFLIGFDADGRIIFSGGNAWLPRTPEALQQIERALSGYMQETASSPVPGIYRAMRDLPAAGKGAARLHVCVIGDEFINQAEPVLRRLDELNPADASGSRRATISAVQLPTTVRYSGPTMGNTGLKFQALMKEVTKQHGGTYELLPPLALQ